MAPKFLTLSEILEFHADPVMGGEDLLEDATRKIASGKLDKKCFASILKKVHDKHKLR